jgi:hypothetical protein
MASTVWKAAVEAGQSRSARILAVRGLPLSKQAKRYRQIPGRVAFQSPLIIDEICGWSDGAAGLAGKPRAILRRYAVTGGDRSVSDIGILSITRITYVLIEIQPSSDPPDPGMGVNQPWPRTH